MGEEIRKEKVTPRGSPAPVKPRKSGIDEQEQKGVTVPSSAAIRFARSPRHLPNIRRERSGGAEPAGFDLSRALDRLEAATGAPWLCLTRAHSQNLRVSGAREARIRDVTDWPETSELLLCADLLISDYSSTAGDYVLLDRPVILYQGDYDRFVGGEREMYFDLRTCPYARAESEAELLALLDDIDALVPRSAAVREFYGVTETGRSAQAVAEWISARLPAKGGTKAQ